MKRRNVLKSLLVIPTISVVRPVLAANEQGSSKMSQKILIEIGGKQLTATLKDNAASRDLISRLPLTLAFEDLYSHEFCYRFERALNTDNVQYRGYEVGEIIYWPPRHSLVIMYAQNGEHFSMQSLGHLDQPVSELPQGSFVAKVSLQK